MEKIQAEWASDPIGVKSQYQISVDRRKMMGSRAEQSRAEQNRTEHIGMPQNRGVVHKMYKEVSDQRLAKV
ncbi:hypothetical protein D5086_030744 [Populus alba]|uniref:Uncharacterized protein n=1 Tax=Populus alba TaxID=43335 RepID=A0ACC4APB4_POPAL